MTVKFAKRLFLVAGIYGIVVVTCVQVASEVGRP